jgi:hypothetical protein
MKAGASDFIEKPIGRGELLASVERALEQSRIRASCPPGERRGQPHRGPHAAPAPDHGMVLAGHPSKNIAADLGISQRTVENHRASIMKKDRLEVASGAARLALAAEHQPGCFDKEVAFLQLDQTLWIKHGGPRPATPAQRHQGGDREGHAKNRTDIRSVNPNA